MSDSAVHTKVTPQSSISKPLPVSGLLQRKCACGQHTGAGGECESCRKKHEDANAKKPGTLQRAAITSAPTPTAKATTDSAAPKVSIPVPKAPTAPPIVNDVLRSQGKPLDAGTRSFMEPRFGQDFSQVRVHTDNKAADSARAVNARAYTVGQHVVFGPGEFAPDTTGGRHLLAHELTHTMQQEDMIHPMQRDGLTIAPADGALEHEADMAAHAVGTRGTTFKKGQRRPSGPVISRKAAKIGERTDEQDSLDKDKQINVGLEKKQKVLAMVKRDARTVAFDIDKFIVPTNKGPQAAYDLYDERAQAGALEATIKVSDNSAGLWQARAGTTSLRKNWLLKVGWSSEEPKELNKLWAKAGGDPKLNQYGGFPIVKGETCEIDHIIELQLGGTNVQNNVQVLGRTENGESGSTIQQEVSTIAQDILNERNKLGLGKDVKEVILHFKSAEPGGKAISKAGTCTSVEIKAADAAKDQETSSEAAEKQNLQEYIVTAAALEASLRAPAPGKDKISTPLRTSSVPENRVGSELIAGLVLEKLDQSAGGKGTDTIDAFIDFGKHSRRQGTRLPLELKDEKKQGALQLNVHKDKAGKGKLSFDSKSKKRVGFTYPYLSEGYLIPEFNEENGFSAKGKLKPSIPLLSKAEIDVALEKDTFSGKVSVPKDKLSPPVKGFRVTKGEIGVELSPVFGASGEVAFEVGPEKKPIADGSIKAKADENGFVAQGKVNAHLPGIDKAEGDITYRKDGFSGGIDVNFTQTKLKYIKGGTAHIGFVGSEIKAEGAIIIQLPRGKEATVSIHRGQQGNWIYKGTGEFDIPKLDPVKLEIEYDGEHLTAKGHTGIVLQGLKGDLAVHYRDGRVSGEGKLALEKGRAKGFVHAKLSDALNISGEGEIQYQLSENLIGTIGVILHEDQSVRLRGALDFPKPIHLFKGFGEEYTLFNYGVQIPILAIPLGPVSAGLVGTIDGGMKVNYGLGPGELRGVHIEGSFNPLEESKDVDIKAGATLVIPAHAGISLYIRGGVGVSIAIASVTGGITATGTAELRGGLEAPVKIEYSKGRYSLNAEPEISAELVLKLGLDADITAEAGVRGFKVEKKIVWNLAAFEWGSGLKFGLIAPLHYASDEPFRAPSVSDIKFVKPDIDLKGLVPRLAKQAGGSKE